MIFSDRSRLVCRLTKIAIITGSLCWNPVLPGSGDAVGVEIGLANTPTTPAPILPQSQKLTSPKVPALDTSIVPGKRVGAITPKTTYADLVKIFGKQRLTSKKVYGAEGLVVFPGTLITLGKNRSLTVAWKDAKQLQPLQVIIADPTFKTASGIGMGTSLAKLRQILGEFKITGLGWDYGNQVIGLSPAIQPQYTGLSIGVDADRIAAKQFPKDYRAVSGDGVTPAASDPHWKPLKMHVSTLSLYFPQNPLPKVEQPQKKKP
ncbi:hypothetical protein [Chamaesiphon sp. VAR_48_metabat_135_sub]|uniref:hypothetical protein n=1 Tax=Chamaesiphon sp. VAR_48_metabat_135_sub TaxID=2964699 RepID=UPI00286B3F74|nr:hypothetical protein [Chamaesiphon sp. VAR_48_metabat_135_sub]